ncbi:MAG: Uma2 family endonuclease [Nocardioidaceae bacterium]
MAPFDVALAPDTIVQPDVLVARRSDLTDDDLPAAPLLAVEVLSPSTQHIDLALKRARWWVRAGRAHDRCGDICRDGAVRRGFRPRRSGRLTCETRLGTRTVRVCLRRIAKQV